MALLKSVKKVLRVLRGTDSFREIFLGVFLGFALGMVPGINLTAAIFCILLFTLKSNISLALVSFVLGKFLCYSLAWVSYSLGYGLIHHLGLLGMAKWMSNTPILALLNWHVYSVFGGLILGLIIGALLGYSFAKGILYVRYAFSEGKEHYKTFAKVLNYKVVKFIINFLLGKPKKNIPGNPPFFAKKRIVVGSSIVVVLFLLQLFFLDFVATVAMRSTLSSITGAEVDVEEVSISLLKGKVYVYGLQVADPDNPYYNKVEAEVIGGDLDMVKLLTKRVVVEEVLCDKMVMASQRKEVAEVYDQEKKVAAEQKDKSLDIFKYGTIADYYSAIKKVNDMLLKIPKTLTSWAQKKDQQKAEVKFKYIDYLNLSAIDSLDKHPVWVIENLKVNRLQPSPGFPAFTIKGNNISSDPRIYPKDMTFSVIPNANVLEILKEPAGQVIDGVKGGLEGVKDTFKGLFGDE